ncbi:hypothetical protein I4U23_017571 [Adineta vaga]|nr:hypothetical protein I4U23_017571 [Adineta vaga]
MNDDQIDWYCANSRSIEWSGIGKEASDLANLWLLVIVIQAFALNTQFIDDSECCNLADDGEGDDQSKDDGNGRVAILSSQKFRTVTVERRVEKAEKSFQTILQEAFQYVIKA